MSLLSNIPDYLIVAVKVILPTYFVLQYLPSLSDKPRKVSNRTSNIITGIEVRGSPYAITINPDTRMFI